MHKILFKRIYDPVESSDGCRILIDRLWPRGITKEKAKIDEWPKAITPTNELRKAYHGEQIDYDEFSKKYEDELENNDDVPKFLEYAENCIKDKNVTLVSSVKDIEASHVPILKKYIEKKIK